MLRCERSDANLIELPRKKDVVIDVPVGLVLARHDDRVEGGGQALTRPLTPFDNVVIVKSEMIINSRRILTLTNIEG
jgi:hypothetical protein